jgi:hypothetical protein
MRMNTHKKIQLTPKHHAEFTFRPKKETRPHKHSDVGLFLDHGEVLALSPLSEPQIIGDRLIIPISCGVVEILQREWEQWNGTLKATHSTFDEARILSEFETD